MLPDYQEFYLGLSPVPQRGWQKPPCQGWEPGFLSSSSITEWPRESYSLFMPRELTFLLFWRYNSEKQCGKHSIDSEEQRLRPVILALESLTKEDWLKFQKILGDRIRHCFLKPPAKQQQQQKPNKPQPTKQNNHIKLECTGRKPQKEIASYIVSPLGSCPSSLFRSCCTIGS